MSSTTDRGVRSSRRSLAVLMLRFCDVLLDRSRVERDIDWQLRIESFSYCCLLSGYNWELNIRDNLEWDQSALTSQPANQPVKDRNIWVLNWQWGGEGGCPCWNTNSLADCDFLYISARLTERNYTRQLCRLQFLQWTTSLPSQTGSDPFCTKLSYCTI